MERFSLVLWETAAFGFSLFLVGGEMAVLAGGCGGSG